MHYTRVKYQLRLTKLKAGMPGRGCVFVVVAVVVLMLLLLELTDVAV
jgi:hypothetical protein